MSRYEYSSTNFVTATQRHACALGMQTWDDIPCSYVIYTFQSPRKTLTLTYIMHMTFTYILCVLGGGGIQGYRDVYYRFAVFIVEQQNHWQD